MQGEVALDRRSKVLYDDWHFFINGEGFRAGGKDAKIMRHLADQGYLTAKELKSLSPLALELVLEWCDAGWLRPC